jgi:general secretion pathway protein J
MFNSRPNSGFTLIEILIAMAIFALIGLGSYSVLTTVINSDELSKNRIEKLQELQRAMLFIERDITQAMPRAARVNGEQNDIVMTGGEDVLDSETDGIAFVRGGWQNPQLVLPRSTLQAVGYRMQEEQLQRVFSNYVDNVIGAEPKVRTVLHGVEDFQIQFLLSAARALNNNDGEDNEGWNDSYTGSEIPAAIAIEVTTADFGLVRREFIVAGDSP